MRAPPGWALANFERVAHVSLRLASLVFALASVGLHGEAYKAAAERRVGRERADEEIRCQVRGKFGSDADEDTDDVLPDTRWVKLSELTDNIREADLKALDEFTKGLNKAIKDARRRLRQ